ncbi:BRO-N domain-containing protein [Ancylobacter polymorphus]|uniref:Bro-N domain-containing protein n=1 Tax=Ancylobacter polymorphus TaxID=223390 RepID=A0A9E6ZSB3_9HYPH|nr:BRO family protein [Ancylobacter polymorphus]UOK70814.1 hypothetical protein K9D25_19220 [Ancylobacter polymorphus]
MLISQRLARKGLAITRNGNATTTYRIRVVPLEGNPWFVATDVCRALGLTLDGGSTRHLRNLNQIDVRRGRVTTGPQGGRPNALISEAGLYELIARSNKAEARAFKDWVFGEVLPTIRKTGGYVLQGAAGRPWARARQPAYASCRWRAVPKRGHAPLTGPA